MSKQIDELISQHVEKYGAAICRADMATRWVELLLDHGVISAFFSNNGLNRISVYGYGKLGKLLIRELEDEGICVEYIIDQCAHKKDFPKKAYSLEDELPPIDVVVVTVSGYNAIKNRLRNKGMQNVISLLDLLDYR